MRQERGDCQIKALYGFPGIALSGYGTDDDLRQSRAAGFDQHIIKPVNFNTLRTAIQQITGMRVDPGGLKPDT